MKFKDVKTLEHLLKEYGASSGGGAVGGGGHGASAKANKSKKSIASGPDVSTASPTVTGQPAQKPQQAGPSTNQVKAKDLQDGDMVVSKDGKTAEVYSKVGQGNNPSALITKDKQGNLAEIPKDETVDAIQPNKPGELDTIPDEKERTSFKDRIKQGMALGNKIAGVDEGKLGKLAKGKGRKLQIRKLKGKIKRLAKSKLKEANPKLFEINFNRKSVAREALDTPVKCGFEAETFFYNVEGGNSSHVDDMSIGDIEYEYGDLPDSAYEDYRSWLYDKGQEDYLDDLVADKIQEVKEDEDWLDEFIDSSSGPSSEAIERYKDDFQDADPKEYENREEDGWTYINWVREYVEEEYEDEYHEWLDGAVREDYNLDDEATEAAEQDYSMDDWVYDNYSYMSDFLNDYGYEYSDGGGDVEQVASELHTWAENNSKFTDFPESGDYGDTYTTTAWAVEKDSSIEPDEGTGAELISPVFDSPRKMLSEMKSLFDWSEENFGTNNSTGLHVTMSWNGEPDAPVDENGRREGQELNKLKMALLLGDPYLLAEFGRLRNSYTKSQYNNILKYAEGMKRGDANSLEEFEKMLSKGIDTGKFNTIHFKDDKDRDSNNKLIEFRIAGGADYNEMYEKVVKAVVRYATVMKAGYDKNAYRDDYVNAVFRLLRKSQEIDPKKLKDLEVVNHPIIDSAKEIVGKKDYFDVVRYLSNSVEYYNEYKNLSDPDADKKWKQSIKDYKKGTGRDPSWVGEAEEGESITGYIEPSSMPPSKRAEGRFQKSQESFINAVVILSRDIADGITRGSVRAKDISIFRDYSKQLELDDKKLQGLALRQLNDQNYNGTDKENIARLKKGIDTLFKRDIIQEPGFMSHQDVDVILKQLWQFFQTDDSDDYHKRVELADLLIGANPNMAGLGNNKDDDEKHGLVMDFLQEISHTRQLNTFVAKLRGSGYGNYITPIESGKMTNQDEVESLKKFLEPYGGYDHPTSKDHHINIKSDDKYEDVAKSSLIQKCRTRLDYIKDLQNSEPEKYQKIKTKLIKIGETLVDTIVAPEDGEGIEGADITDKDGTNISGFIKDQYNRQDSWCLNLHRRDWNNTKDFLAKSGDKDDDTYNFTSAYDDYVVRNPFSMVLDYYKSKSDFANIHKNSEVKKIVKNNFAGFKKFFNEFDKIFTSEGFTDLKAEISDKDRYDKRNKDFEKNVRDNAKAKLNIPSHSFIYFDKDFWETLTDNSYADRGPWLDNNLDHFGDDLNKEGKIYVIPSAHWSQADDAFNGLDLIKNFENAKNYFHTWRRIGYNKILSKFMAKYNVSFENLTDRQGKYMSQPDNMESTLSDFAIEVTHKGDSRSGAPGQEDLVPTEDLENPNSGEPINRGSAMMWDQSTDDAEKKRFDAFDWGLYPTKMKDVVAKEMENESSFQLALQNVLQKVLDNKVDIDQNDLGLPDEKIMYAAGVDGSELEGKASNTISQKANWTNLADYLKLERGVNDQGVNLLKKVHSQYDSDGQKYRTKDDNITVGMERWLLAVKDAIKYIETNYKVSGGNYFRDGDDVSDVHSSTTDHESGVAIEDYDEMRSKYFNFNAMMMNGMQNYLVQTDVNRLVGFLKNPDNDEEFKKDVLQSMMRERELGMEPNDFQGALARGRMYSQRQRESVFNRFENLPLEEQLTIISKSKVLENLSKKSEGPSSDALPDNSIPYLLNKLLAEPMKAGDLRKQMDAYWALPVPQMLSDFRAVRAQGGKEADCRNILKQYINSQLDPQIKKHVKLVENKDDVIDRIKGLPDEDKQTDKVVQYIEQLLDDMGVGGRLASLTSNLEDIDDEEVKKSNVKLAKIISSIEMTPLERAQLFASWKQDKLIDVKKLLSGNGQTFSEVFKGYGDEIYMTELIDDLADVDSYGIGAGEFLLAVLSQKIKGIGSTGGSGDLLIDGRNVEVKTKTSRNARFKDWHVQPDQTWASKVEKFKQDFADIDEVSGAATTGMNSTQLSAMLKNPVLQQNPERKKQALLSIMAIFKATNTNLSSAQYKELVNLLDAGDDSAFKQKYGAYNILNYLNIKRSDGELEGILFMNKKTKTVHYVKDLNDIQNLALEVGTIYPISTNSIYPYPQIGVK